MTTSCTFNDWTAGLTMKLFFYLRLFLLLVEKKLYLILCMRAWMEVTGSHSTRAKIVLFLDNAGLGHYGRQPTDTASNGPAVTKVRCFKRTAGQN